MFSEDLGRLEEFFHCDGDGVPRQELQDASREIWNILGLADLASPDLVSQYKDAVADEAMIESFNPRGGLGMWHLRKSDVYALVLSHRRDKDAVDFYKKVRRHL